MGPLFVIELRFCKKLLFFIYYLRLMPLFISVYTLHLTVLMHYLSSFLLFISMFSYLV